MGDHEIKVGVSVSLSGKFQLQGQQALHGLLLWQSYVNAQGGITVGGSEKRLVHLIWYDDRSQISSARAQVLRLVREDHIDILLGPYSSSLTMAVAEIAEEYRKILWNYGGSSDEIFNRGWRHLVGIASSASDYLRALPRWLLREEPMATRICVLYASSGTFGRQVARGILESAAALRGYSIKFVPLKSPLNNIESLRSTLFTLSPQVVVLAAGFHEEVVLMHTRYRWPRTVRVIAAVAAGVRAFYAELDQKAEGVLGPSQWEPGVSFPEIIGPASDWFIDSFDQCFAGPPDYVAAGSFATGVILTECIRRADSLDNDTLGRIARDLDCNTFYGRFRVDPDTGKQTGHRVLLTRCQRGQKIIQAPPVSP